MYLSGFIICFSLSQNDLKPLLTYQLKDLERVTSDQSNGSILSNISQDVLKKLYAIIPSDSVIQKFNKQIVPIWEKLDKTLNEISNLTKQRDELLPLLMNGQVSLNSDLSSLRLYYRVHNKSENNERKHHSGNSCGHAA